MQARQLPISYRDLKSPEIEPAEGTRGTQRAQWIVMGRREPVAGHHESLRALRPQAPFIFWTGYRAKRNTARAAPCLCGLRLCYFRRTDRASMRNGCGRGSATLNGIRSETREAEPQVANPAIAARSIEKDHPQDDLCASRCAHPAAKNCRLRGPGKRLQKPPCGGR
jgi:hypothetical protein